MKKPEPSLATQYGERMRSIGYLGSIPILMAVGPIIGLLAGKWLDEKLATDPWLTILFTLFGIAAAIREIARLLRKANEADRQSDSKNKR